MHTIRRSNDRGYADFGWLKSRHSFSFANYYDPAHMGVSALRVINDDVIHPGAGFDPHPHRDMEIITYVTQGAIAHADNTGNREILKAGEVQVMSAGSGIVHAEFNASETDELRLLQIWIKPAIRGLAPGYQQKAFARTAGWQLIASPDGAEGSLPIHQDARLWRLTLDKSDSSSRAHEGTRPYYVHLVSGQLEVNGETLAPGDAITVVGEDIEVSALADSEALVFDLPEE